MKYRTDVNYSGENQDAVYDKLKGKVELKHVTFGYSPLAPALIEDFSMRGATEPFISWKTAGRSVRIPGRFQSVRRFRKSDLRKRRKIKAFSRLSWIRQNAAAMP